MRRREIIDLAACIVAEHIGLISWPDAVDKARAWLAQHQFIISNWDATNDIARMLLVRQSVRAFFAYGAVLLAFGMERAAHDVDPIPAITA